MSKKRKPARRFVDGFPNDPAGTIWGLHDKNCDAMTIREARACLKKGDCGHIILELVPVETEGE